MNKTLLTTLSLVAVSIVAMPVFAAPSAREIMQKNEVARKFSDIEADAVLTNLVKNQEDKQKKFTWWRKLQENGQHYSTFTRFHHPAEVRNQGILFLEKADGQADVLMYLPNMKRTRRVERQSQSKGFMGSEFSYADIATPHLEDFTYTLVKESDACLDSKKCYVVDAMPANENVKDRLAYSKQRYWIEHGNFMVAKGEFYDLDGKLLKRLECRDTQELDKANKRWFALKMEIINVQNERSTRLEFSRIKVNQGIPDSKFTQQNMERP